MGPWALKTHCLRPIIPKDWRGALFYQNTQAWSFPPLAHDVLLDGNATEKDIFGKWCPAENHYSIRIRLIGVVSSNSFVQRQGEIIFLHQFSSVPSLSRVQLSETQVQMHVQLLSSIQLSCHPMDCSPPCSSVHGISQARILAWVGISFSRLFTPW